MAVMSPQPPISAQDQKISSAAPTPASAGAGSMASDEVMGMDLDNSGSKQNESPSVHPDFVPSSLQNDDKNGSRFPFVNGDRGVRAPPSPPIPTPPLHHSSDNGRDLSDLHITSPDGSVLPSGNFSSVTEDSPMEGSEQTAAEQSSTDAKADTGSAGEALRRADSSTHANNDQAMSDLLSKKSGRNREDDDGEDRPPKRAKTADAPDTNLMVTNNPSSAEFSGPLTAARTKFVIGVIRSLRRTKDARPFTMPVDAVRLNVPTYYDIIKHPMDLQTMERKLNNNEYSDLGSFISDFNQILKNCMTFNGPDHAVTFMSKSMEAAFYRHMKYLPSEDVVDVEKPKTAKKKGGGVLSGAAAVSARSAAAGVKSSAVSAKATPIAKPKTKKEPKSSVAHSPSATSPVFSLQPSGMPQIRRDSTAGDGRPKREIHPPAPKDLPYSTKPRRKQNAAELKFCDSILKELHKKAHEAYAFPFYHPVDPVALNIPDYFKVIKRPMDLSTVQDRLKMNAYENANEFEADIRLMFNNCYKFNPPSQAVHQMGRELEAVFDLKWSEKPSYSNNQGSRSPQTASPAPHDEDELSEEEEEETDEQQNIAELEKNLEKLKEQISAIKKGQKKKSPPAQSKSKPKGGGRKITSSTAAHTSHTKKTKPVPYVSMEQKTELSERINLLPPSKMHFALDMIKDNMPDIGNDGAEVELDIDELDPHTLHKLYKYVSKNAPELPTKYIPPPPPPAERTSETKAKSKPGTKGRKNKPMSAAEQEAKIKDIETRIHSFENPNYQAPALQPTNANSDSSDDDDESSGSESEEE